MSFHTQSAQRRAFGKSHLTPKERYYHIPWYASEAWEAKKRAIRQRLKNRAERTLSRKLEREDIANGVSPEQARLRRVERETKDKGVLARVLDKIGL